MRAILILSKMRSVAPKWSAWVSKRVRILAYSSSCCGRARCISYGGMDAKSNFLFLFSSSPLPFPFPKGLWYALCLHPIAAHTNNAVLHRTLHANEHARTHTQLLPSQYKRPSREHEGKKKEPRWCVSNPCSVGTGCFMRCIVRWRAVCHPNHALSGLS